MRLRGKRPNDKQPRTYLVHLAEGDNHLVFVQPCRMRPLRVSAKRNRRKATPAAVGDAVQKEDGDEEEEEVENEQEGGAKGEDQDTTTLQITVEWDEDDATIMRRRVRRGTGTTARMVVVAPDEDGDHAPPAAAIPTAGDSLLVDGENGDHDAAGGPLVADDTAPPPTVSVVADGGDETPTPTTIPATVDGCDEEAPPTRPAKRHRRCAFIEDMAKPSSPKRGEADDENDDDDDEEEEDWDEGQDGVRRSGQCPASDAEDLRDFIVADDEPIEEEMEEDAASETDVNSLLTLSDVDFLNEQP